MRRSKAFLVLAIVSAFTAAIVVFSALRQRERQMQKALAERVDIVVAARDIPLGQKLGPDALKLVQWSRDAIPPGSFTDPMAVVGNYANDDFVSGEPIVEKKLVSADKAPAVMQMMIPRGMRAMSVAVDEVGDIAGFVKPHTRVDVLVALSSGPDSKSFSKIVLQDVEVLAVAQQLERTKEDPEIAKVVTLLVTPHQAEKLGVAGREGTLRLAMRNYADDRVISTSGSNLSDLLGVPVENAAPTIKTQGASAAAENAARAVRRGPPPYRIRIMRDGKKLETLSFIATSTRTPKDAEPPEADAPAEPQAAASPLAMQTPLPAHPSLPAAQASALDVSGAISPDAAAVPKNIELP